jgi:glutamine amidotransferase
MGYQVLFTATDEGGDHPCLDVVEGRVRKLPSTNGGGSGLKIPHMGWNNVRQSGDHPVFEGIADDSYFYFVHSFYPAPDDESLVIGRTDYGVTFASAIARRRLVATQFHPEKSGAAGLRLYKNFLTKCA